MNNILNYLENAQLKFPNKRAVALRDQQLTFRELWCMARRLGTTLIRTKKHLTPIGIFANRSINTIGLFLAVVYSGNFYVPLDPEMPIEKLKNVIDDAGLDILLGEDINSARLLELSFNGLFLTPEDQEKTVCEMVPVSKDAPLYMVYTSGSTGRPKGVVKSHGAMISFIESYCHTFSFGCDEVIGNQTPFFFDASAKDIYLMLKTGSTLEIIPTELFSSVSPILIDFLNEKKITFISWVPTALSFVAQLNFFSLVKPIFLRKVFFVGEVMPIKHLNKWREALPSVQYVNLYGQSELAGICCYYEVPVDTGGIDTLPIGKPMENCRIFLRDPESRAVISEPNRIGELYIQSAALADGYYRDPDKTAACFVTADMGYGEERTFKTGDLAQYDRDGNLIFATRSDFQIKHMGYRIELGEIENVATALPGVSRCCCIYQKEKRKIILYYEPERNNDQQPDNIWRMLKERLSAYMMPTKVIPLAHLPMNANGKIDRRALHDLP